MYKKYMKYYYVKNMMCYLYVCIYMYSNTCKNKRIQYNLQWF